MRAHIRAARKLGVCGRIFECGGVNASLRELVDEIALAEHAGTPGAWRLRLPRWAFASLAVVASLRLRYGWPSLRAALRLSAENTVTTAGTAAHELAFDVISLAAFAREQIGLQSLLWDE